MKIIPPGSTQLTHNENEPKVEIERNSRGYTFKVVTYASSTQEQLQQAIDLAVLGIETLDKRLNGENEVPS